MRFLNDSLYFISPSSEYLHILDFYDSINSELNKTRTMSSDDTPFVDALENYVINSYPISDTLNWTLTSPDSNSLFFKDQNGNLNVVERNQDGEYVLEEGLEKTPIEFLDLKQDLQGMISITNKSDHRYMLIDLDFTIIFEVPSLGNKSVPNEMLKYVDFSTLGHDTNIFLWLPGNSTIGVVDVNSREYEIINWPTPGQPF